MSDKAEPTRDLVAHSPTNVLEYSVATLEVVHSVNTHVLDMTPEAAAAHMEIARLQFAVPAEQATKQAEESTKQAQQLTIRSVSEAKELTKQQLIRYAPTGVCVLAALIAVCFVPVAGWPIAAIVGVLGAGHVVTRWLDKSKLDENSVEK